MACEHKRLKCTNNVFFCLDCGALIAANAAADKQEGQEEKPAEAPKTGRKRKAKTQAD